LRRLVAPKFLSEDINVKNWLLLGLVLLLQACASVTTPDRRDPLESWNRAVFSFNEAVDGAVLKPVATVYQDSTPRWLQTGVGNFFNNLEDMWSVVNNALQLRAQDTGDSMGRVMINTTLGLFGVLNVAGDLNIERHPANFGLTLGRWGVGPGPYLVLPLLGPSSLREVVALPVDTYGSVVAGIDDDATRLSMTALNIVDTRASFLQAEKIVNGAALDKYSFMRDVSLQRRRNQVYDGNPPEESMGAEP
jgi:phospholipid-binding lipoprotein MlaA